MGRTLDPVEDAALDAPVTRKRFLVNMQYSSSVRLYSGIGDVSWNNVTWTSAPFTVSGPTQERGGVLRARLTFLNVDEVYTALFLGAEGVSGIGCRILSTESKVTPIPIGETQVLIDGYMTTADIGRDAVIEVRQTSAETAFAPRLLISPPTFNHVIQAGTVVSWEGERYEITRGR